MTIPMETRKNKQSARSRTICALIVACSWLTACGGRGSTPSLGPAPTMPSGGGSSIDQVVRAHYAGGWGVELAIYKNGTPLYAHGYGLRDRGLPPSRLAATTSGASGNRTSFSICRAASSRLMPTRCSIWHP